jgi:hypothetical protein
LALEEVSINITMTLFQRAHAEVTGERSAELEQLREKLATLEAEIEKEAKARAEGRFREVKLPTGRQAVERITGWLKRHNHSHWRHSIGSIATRFLQQLS